MCGLGSRTKSLICVCSLPLSSFGRFPVELFQASPRTLKTLQAARLLDPFAAAWQAHFLDRLPCHCLAVLGGASRALRALCEATSAALSTALCRRHGWVAERLDAPTPLEIALRSSSGYLVEAALTLHPKP